MKIQSDRSILDRISKSVVLFDVLGSEHLSRNCLQKILTTYNDVANETLMSAANPSKPPVSKPSLYTFCDHEGLYIANPCHHQYCLVYLSYLILFRYCPICFLAAVNFEEMKCREYDKIIWSRVTLTYREF